MIEPVMTVFSRGRPKYRRRRWWEWPRTVVCASGSCPALGRRVVRWWTGSRTPRRGRAVVTGLRLRIAAACPEYNPGGQLPMPAAEPVQALFFLGGESRCLAVAGSGRAATRVLHGATSVRGLLVPGRAPVGGPLPHVADRLAQAVAVRVGTDGAVPS